MGNKETPSLKKDIFVNIQTQSISIEQNCILIAGGKVRIKKITPHTSSTVYKTWCICFRPPCQATRSGCTDIYLTPSPLSVSDPLRKRNPSTHPAGSSLFPSQNRKRGREWNSTQERTGVSAGNRNPSVLHAPLGSCFFPRPAHT